jgi:hypothetical protein
MALATFIPSRGAHPDEVGFELGDHGQDVEQQSPDRVGRVVHRASEVELDLALGELVGDRASVGQRPREAAPYSLPMARRSLQNNSDWFIPLTSMSR